MNEEEEEEKEVISIFKLKMEFGGFVWFIFLYGMRKKRIFFSVFNENAVKKLKAYGCACHVRLHQTYAIIQGYTKFLKLRIHFTYKNIQQIRLIYANERLEQIMVSFSTFIFSSFF